MSTEKRTGPATVTRIYYICDVCGFDTTNRLAKCELCGRHFCNNCKKEFYDINNLKCMSCYSLENKYQPKIDEMYCDSENKIIELENIISDIENITSHKVCELKEKWGKESLDLVSKGEN